MSKASAMIRWWEVAPGWTVIRSYTGTKHFADETWPTPSAMMLAMAVRRDGFPHDVRRVTFRARADLDSPASVTSAHQRLRAMALAALREAAVALDQRTKDREARGVEGTHRQ